MFFKNPEMSVGNLSKDKWWNQLQLDGKVDKLQQLRLLVSDDASIIFRLVYVVL